jgi:hypothetical protein
MSKNYLIFGVKRTGNHAIISWLIPQIGETVRFFNDQKYAELNLSRVNDEHYLVEHILQLYRTKLFVNYVSKRSFEVFSNNYLDVDNIISFEGIKLNRMLDIESQWLQDLNRGVKRINPKQNISGDNKYIIILRNPWNIVASQIKKISDMGGMNNMDINRDTDVWIEFYKHYIEKTKPNTHYIIFDKWFIDIEYRKKISTDLGIEFSDINLNHVSGIGGGSSFDKVNFNGNAQKMNVLKRYEEMASDKKMLNFLKTEKAIELKNKWNHICDLENITNLIIK